ncbi:hypothetical protein [Bradyrhizobium sp. I1.7.5]|uniref:hypothetical protein n=1 Tax=Bradyrhizobium sp. I1.7.5 TaxID=3156363 RepID=UPI0033980012
MKKAKKARPIGRTGRNPVIAVRVTPALHNRITESAKISGRSMSEEMAALLTRGFEWEQAFGDRVNMLEQARAEIDRMVGSNFKAEMRRRGWKPLHGTPHWIDPEAAAITPSGFVDPTVMADNLTLGAALNSNLDDMIDKIADRIARKLKPET